jgi:pimeloyl-ACP methyl ester carboxylesterase
VLLSDASWASVRAAARAGDDYGTGPRPAWREIDWLEHLRDAVVDGRRMRYVDVGSGDVVLFVHGLASRWQNWLEAIPAVVESGRRAIAVDLPGFGKSDMPSEPITIPGFGRALAGLMRTLGIERACVVGNSMGGLTAADFAAQEPEMVDRVVLVDAAGISLAQHPNAPPLRIVDAFARLGGSLAARPPHVPRRPLLQHLLFSSVVRHPTLLADDLLDECVWWTDDPGFVPALRALRTYDIRDRLPQVTQPTLVMAGRDDMLVPWSDAKLYAELIGGAELLVLDDTGHMPMLERPKTFNAAVQAFLEAE